jgi:TPR repeat protein
MTSALAGTASEASPTSPASPYIDRIEALEHADRNVEAFALAKVGAAAGDPASEYKVASLLSYGIGTKRDKTKSTFWTRKAAEAGFAPAQNDIGSMYWHGRGVPENDAKAFYWYEKSARQGDRMGLFTVAMLYDIGHGVAQDQAKAATILRGLASHGDESAQAYLNQMDPSQSALASVPAPGAQVVSCRTSCVNGACSRIYQDGRRVEFQAAQKFNPLTNAFEWDPGAC